MDHWQDPLYRNSYLLILNSMTFTLSGFVFWLVAARMVTPETVGLATAIVSSVMLLGLLAKLGFDVSLLRFLPGQSAEAGAKLVNTMFTICILAAIVASSVFVMGTPLWSPTLTIIRDKWSFFLGYVVLTIIWTQGALLDLVFLARRRAEFVVAKNALNGGLRLAALFVLVPFGQAAGIVVSAIGTMLLASSVASIAWIRRVLPGFLPRPKIDGASLHTVLRSSFANYAAQIIMALPLTVGSLLILHRHGASETAYFYVLWMFGSVAMMAPIAFGQSSLVEMAHRPGMVAGLHARTLVISGLAALAVLVAGSILLPIFGDFYAGRGIFPLVPYALAALPGLLLQLRLSILRVSERHAALIGVTSTAVVVFVGPLAILDIAIAMIGWVWLAGLSSAALGAELALRIPRHRRVTPQSDINASLRQEGRYCP